MKKMLMLAILALAAVSFAQEQDPALQTTATLPEVKKELSEIDGVAIVRAEDGSWKIFARGTGTYDFNDPEEIRDAKAQAQLRAKAALSKFLKETITASNGMDKLSKKTKNLSKNGDVTTKSVNKEEITVMRESIASHSEAILTGVIVLTEEKVPHGSEGGEIQVTLGQSSKTLEAAKATRQAINASLDDSTPARGGVSKAAAPAKANDYYYRRSNTDF